MEKPSFVMDSGATSTCIKMSNAANVNTSNENSTKIFCNANITKSATGKKANINYAL